jgi:hypothetical protein
MSRIVSHVSYGLIASHVSYCIEPARYCLGLSNLSPVPCGSCCHLSPVPCGSCCHLSPVPSGSCCHLSPVPCGSCCPVLVIQPVVLPQKTANVFFVSLSPSLPPSLPPSLFLLVNRGLVVFWGGVAEYIAGAWAGRGCWVFF